MKINIIALALVSLTYTPTRTFFTRKTTTIAAEKGYPDFLVQLRNKATDFTVREKVRMKLEIDDLRKQDLNYRANELSEQYKEAYFDLEENLDMVFEKISHDFLTEAAKLDRNNASANEKEALIARTKENALQVVTTKLQSYEMFNKNNT